MHRMEICRGEILTQKICTPGCETLVRNRGCFLLVLIWLREIYRFLCGFGLAVAIHCIG